MRIKRFLCGAATPCVALFAAANMAVPAYADAPPLNAFGNMPAIEDVDLSPDGSRSAAIATTDGKRRLIALDSNDKPIAIIPLEDQKITGIRWAGNDFLIVNMRRTAAIAPGAPKQEFGMSAVVNLNDNGKTYWVFEKRADMIPVVAGSYGIRQIDGRWYAFYGGYRSTERHSNILASAKFQLFKVDLETGKFTMVAKDGPEGYSRDWVLDERGEVVATLDSNTDNGKWVIRNAAGVSIASGEDTKDMGVGMAALSPDGTHVYYATWDDEVQEHRLSEIALADGTRRAQPTVPADIEGVLTAEGSERALGWVGDGFGALPTFFDNSRNEAIASLKKTFPDKVISIADFSVDLNMIVFKTQGPGDPGSWYQLDVANRNAWRVGADYPTLKPDNVGEVRVITYTAQDGLEIEAILTLPPGLEPKNLPVVMLPHGGPHAHDEPRFDWWAQAVASRGYLVVQPNFRGSTNKDRAFETAGYGQWGAKMQTDLDDALKHLTGLGMIDPNRACIVGASYGGYAALAGVTIQQGLYKCAVSVAGVSDLQLQIDDAIKTNGNSRALDRYFKRAIGKGRDLIAISPAYHAARADAPILLIHGKDDTVVDINQSDRMAKQLAAAGKPFEYVKLDGEDHWLSRGDTRLSMLEATLAFVEKYNPPGPLPAQNAAVGQ